MRRIAFTMENYIRNQIRARRLKESEKSPTGSPNGTIHETRSVESDSPRRKRKVDKDVKVLETKTQILRRQANTEKMQLMEKK